MPAQTSAVSAPNSGVDLSTFFSQMAYCSVLAQQWQDQDTLQLMAHAQSANAQHGITGLMMLEDHLVIQWIEGPSAAVEKLWANIQNDARHHSLVTLVCRRQQKQRLFADWSMRRASRQDMLAIVRQAQQEADADADADHPMKHAISTLSILLDPELSTFYTQAIRTPAER